MLPHNPCLEILNRMKAERDTTRPQIASIQSLPRRFVERVAISLGPFAGNTEVQSVVDQWQIDHAFKPAFAIVSDICRSYRLKILRGLR